MPKDAAHTWSPDWVENIANRTHELGFRNLTELLASMPGRPYAEVAERLGPSLEPIQIIAVQYKEAKDAGLIRKAAQDSICRRIKEHLPDGWGIGAKAEWQAIRALSSWSSNFKATAECEYLEPTLTAILIAFRDSPPPNQWRPSGPNDPIIQTVFDANWPESRASC
jgi:hypothetical protein